jgi:hypothetical protein
VETRSAHPKTVVIITAPSAIMSLNGPRAIRNLKWCLGFAGFGTCPEAMASLTFSVPIGASVAAARGFGLGPRRPGIFSVGSSATSALASPRAARHASSRVTIGFRVSNVITTRAGTGGLMRR